jgi:hypothetical protein
VLDVTGSLTVGTVAVPTISSTNTLTNKRVTPRTGTTTSSATPTINTDNVDFYSLTAQAVDITSFTTNLSGTPTDGQTLWIAIMAQRPERLLGELHLRHRLWHSPQRPYRPTASM